MRRRPLHGSAIAWATPVLINASQVSLLTIMLGIVYFPGKGSMPTNSDTAIKLATSAGTVVGQVTFGALADIIGRKKMYGLELMIIIFATLGHALASSSPSVNIVGLIIFWRVLMVSLSAEICNMRRSANLTIDRALVLEATTPYPALSPPNSRLQSGVEP
jgi:MFS family permease